MSGSLKFPLYKRGGHLSEPPNFLRTEPGLWSVRPGAESVLRPRVAADGGSHVSLSLSFPICTRGK